MIDMRPKDLALFLLASGDLMPRKRARDQQADVAGLEIKRHVLDMLATIDPEPAERLGRADEEKTVRRQVLREEPNG